MRNRLIFILFAALLFGACKEPFTPSVTSTNNNLLVVEGFINSGSDSTIIKLSRTVVVGEKNNTTNPEIGALVTVEGENNETYNLPELTLKKGTYAFPGLNLNASKKYRIKIKTNNGSSYVSDFVNVKISSPIDDINWEVKGNKVELSVNTHDNTNMSRYYRWEYVETYIFYSKFTSVIEWNGVGFVDRDLTNNDISKCWGTSNSSTIILGSTAKLSQDVIFKSPITSFPINAEKVTEKYSILVKQYILSKEEYEFWELLKKNTENLGSMFDAQPSSLVGNVHNVDDMSEPVIGFIGIGTVQQKRIYIKKEELPSVRNIYPFDCLVPLDVIPRIPTDYRDIFSSGSNIPIDYSEKGVYASTRECVDCTIRGVNKKPSFWQ